MSVLSLSKSLIFRMLVKQEFWKIRTRHNLLTETISMASEITKAQQAFIKAIEDKANSQLGNRLDGKFQMVNYPQGFNYGITYGNNAYYNEATLKDIDTLLGTSSSGGLELISGDFSGCYLRLLQAVTFSFSSADNQVMNKQDTAAQAQIASILREFDNAGGSYTNPLPFGGKFQDVINQLNTQFKSLDNIPDTMNSLRNAIATYKTQAAESYALHSKWYEAQKRLDTVKANTQAPNGTNGGMQVDNTSYYVGYTPDKLPTVNQLLGWLQSSNELTVSISTSYSDSTTTQLHIDGGASLSISSGLFSFDFGGSASYDESRYTSSSSTMTITISYPGLTVFSALPSDVSKDNQQGWYANDILQEIVENTGVDATGYKLQGSEYDIDEIFGTGKKFSRLKTWVISQQPEISITFKGADTSKLQQDFKQDASLKVKLFDLFTIGPVSETYKVKKIQTDSQTGEVSLTLGPPAVSGTIPLQQQVAYVLGGVASYPPNNI
jgi:hypothetical protein